MTCREAAGHVQVAGSYTDTYTSSGRMTFKHQTVIDEFKTLEDGAGYIWKMPPGHYEIEMTSTGDGASVAWVGASCRKANEATTYSATCRLDRTSQMAARWSSTQTAIVMNS